MNGNFCQFALIVTGAAEQKCLDKLFRGLCKAANCRFFVLRKIEQLSPITSPKRILGMVGSGKKIPDKDAERIGYPARRFLAEHRHNFVLVIDDLEHHRRESARDVFDRYRSTLDEVLVTDELRHRAAVHFLVIMLEAYYFAHGEAVNSVAGRQILDGDCPTDVEGIRNPKGDLRARWPEYSEMEHAPQILSRLDLDHVLSNDQTCRWLRSAIAWIVSRLIECEGACDPAIESRYRLQDGATSAVTFPQ